MQQPQLRISEIKGSKYKGQQVWLKGDLSDPDEKVFDGELKRHSNTEVDEKYSSCKDNNLVRSPILSLGSLYSPLKL
ncbi:hypothetical protein MHLP_00725 [Candidatus Mycoplasma haematolamae str. Purdue]|uniref:Uncharacterized protein n=1 Tax=Mycoplasma haematolamae (strain Purdue) TaxID=1212765 RepID=I7B900_MYCHA|nr:hypothetical protein MHLP_00725 [Candidatus Mycoplasma haematolamae str. Purdue]